MRVHELAQSKSGKLPDMPVSALYLLAAPSTPESARDDVLDLAANGGNLSKKSASDMCTLSRGHQALAAMLPPLQTTLTGPIGLYPGGVINIMLV